MKRNFGILFTIVFFVLVSMFLIIGISIYFRYGDMTGIIFISISFVSYITFFLVKMNVDKSRFNKYRKCVKLGMKKSNAFSLLGNKTINSKVNGNIESYVWRVCWGKSISISFANDIAIEYSFDDN